MWEQSSLPSNALLEVSVPKTVLPCRLQRAVVFQGQSNDPVAAFFSLSESVAADVLAVVTPRVREDSRVIFKR